MSEEKIITENQSANEAEAITEQTDSISASAKTENGVKENTSEKKAVYYNGGNTGDVWDGTDFATSDLKKEPYFGQLDGMSETKVF